MLEIFIFLSIYPDSVQKTLLRAAVLFACKFLIWFLTQTLVQDELTLLNI